MNFLLTEEHIQIRDLLRDFFETSYGGEKIKKYLFESRNDQTRLALKTSWDRFAELGALGGGVSEDLGGLGLGFINHVVLVSESSRVLSPLPVLETLLFGILPAGFLAGEQNETLESLISGSEIAAGYFSENLISEVGNTLYFDSGNELKSCKLDNSLKYQPLGAELIRGSRKYEKPGEVVTLGQIHEPSLLKLSKLVLVSAELIACARAAEEQTLEFVKTRKQFGVSISTFQSIQHKLSDVRVKLDSAESLLYFAAWAKDNSPTQFKESALGSFLHAQQISKAVIEECLQLHGGMGFTWESNIHLYLRRVLSTSLWCGEIGKFAVELAELENSSSVG